MSDFLKMKLVANIYRMKFQKRFSKFQGSQSWFMIINARWRAGAECEKPRIENQIKEVYVQPWTVIRR